MPFAVVIFLLVPTNFAFGLIAPNAIAAGHAAVPQIAGDAGAVTSSIQMMLGAVASWLIGRFYGEHSVLSMNAPVAARSLAALVSYLLLARRAERVVVPC